MLIAMNRMNERVLAKNAKRNQIYRCPYCLGEVILRHGVKVIPHFANKVKSTRPCYKAETYNHYQLKMLLAQKFKAMNYDVDIEPFFKCIKQYPDLVINQRHAIEIQCSTISTTEIIERTLGLKSIGLKVYWIINDVKKRGDFIELTQFQTTFINPIHRTLITWDFTKSRLIVYTHLQNIAGKKFICKRHTIQLKQLFNTYQSEQAQIYKLSKRTINNYILQCRRENTVLEPTLSAIYQLQMNDNEVCINTGFIFPNQIYIETHPVEWQLKYLLLRCKYDSHQSCDLLMSIIKFRYFAYYKYHKLTILKDLLNDFEKMYYNRCLSVQNQS
ncbi:competence protein CoiA [Staphylococcus capitis]|uniref:competence protein CoiA n=1 Tax=Staphylococcus capitis TaxID=29388 RepID=UPI001889BD98|nr:competence protein CoiA family protein [Staphylococcus capitis]MBF2260875.1 transcription factor [Staphylococcus capitis]MBF2281201.1 transcription factor [Staphylococcus capitis]